MRIYVYVRMDSFVCRESRTIYIFLRPKDAAQGRGTLTSELTTLVKVVAVEHKPIEPIDAGRTNENESKIDVRIHETEQMYKCTNVQMYKCTMVMHVRF